MSQRAWIANSRAKVKWIISCHFTSKDEMRLTETLSATREDQGYWSFSETGSHYFGAIFVKELDALETWYGAIPSEMAQMIAM